MFTPHRVAGGPGRDIKLTKTRVTIGTFVASGEQFKIIDHYTEPKAAHMMLEHAWVGTTEFKELINYEGANINASTKWADWASDEEFVGFDAGASARPHVGDSEKGQLKMFEEKVKPDAKAYTHRALLSLSARVPLRRGHPVGGRWRDRACTVSAISLIARSSDRIDGGRKFESHNPRRGLGALASGKLGRLSILVRPSPTSSMQVFSSETQVVGEGEYKTDTDRLRETSSECGTLARQTSETTGKRAHARADLCKQVKRSKCLRWHLAQGETAGQNSCAAARSLSGLAALSS